MTNADHHVITELEAVLTSQEYSPVVVRNYCAYARGFLDHLAQRNIPVADVAEAHVEQYLRGNRPIWLAVTHECLAALRGGLLQRGRRGGRSHARLPSSPVVRRKRGRGSLRAARRP